MLNAQSALQIRTAAYRLIFQSEMFGVNGLKNRDRLVNFPAWGLANLAAPVTYFIPIESLVIRSLSQI